jgi:crossover junction endodeoxyribonuclease RusA
MTSFFAAGNPVPQGSARAMINNHTGRAVLVQSSRSALHRWRDDIKAAALAASVEYRESGPVWLSMEFRLLPPKHVPKDRCGRPTTPPDIDKAQRACLDALTAVAYRDDAQVVSVRASKRYCLPGEPAGVFVEVKP